MVNVHALTRQLQATVDQADADGLLTRTELQDLRSAAATLAAMPGLARTWAETIRWELDGPAAVQEARHA